jgi:hypothetical protein
MTGLVLIAAAYGAIAVSVFRKFTKKLSLQQSVNRILAHLMELGLFLESPALVFRAQRELMLENLRLLRLILVPACILGAVFAILVPVLNAMYGRAPLPVGQPSVVTVQLTDGTVPVELETPTGIAIETPGVRDMRDRQVSWRVRPLVSNARDFEFRVANRVVTDGMFLHDPSIRAIDIRYPHWTMWGFTWLWWFVAISSVSSMAVATFWKR